MWCTACLEDLHFLKFFLFLLAEARDVSVKLKPASAAAENSIHNKGGECSCTRSKVEDYKSSFRYVLS